jgi:hypothetical protein
MVVSAERYWPRAALARKSASGEIRSMRRRLLLAMVLGAIAACGHRERSRAPAATIPAYAPDSTPLAIRRELARPDNVLVDAPGISGRVVRNALYVRFTETASERERNAALRAVGAVVVGGMRMNGAEYYHIRIDAPADSGAVPLLRARDTLRALPQVRSVLLDVLDAMP